MAAYAAEDSSQMNNFTSMCMSTAMMNSKGFFMGTNPMDYAVPLLLIQISVSSAIILLISKLLKPLLQPLIVSQILGGIILGPSVLGSNSIFTRSFFPLTSFLVLDTLSTFGYMFYFFLIGVRVDPWIVKSIDKRACALGISTVATPWILSTLCSFILPRYINVDTKIASSLTTVALVESVLSFPIIAQSLSELKIINSEFGRVAIASSVVSNLLSFCAVTLVVSLKEHHGSESNIIMTIINGIVVAMVIVVVLRPPILWIIKQNPQGEPLKEEYILAVSVCVLVTGFCGQSTGLNILFGPLVLGMAIPAGPPLGSALVEKLDLITSWIFMPLFFVKNGLAMNIFGIQLKNYVVVQFLIFICCTGKFVGALLPSLYYQMPMKDAVALSLVMNTQGVLELGMFNMMKEAKAIEYEAFLVMCISLTTVTGVITPLIKHLYDPSRRYAVYGRRTVMDMRSNSELRVLVCVHDQENVPATINLLETFNPTKASPIAIHVLHLNELVGRANPVLMAHQQTKSPSSKVTTSERIVNAFRCYGQSNQGITSVQTFTAISPYETMHDDVCTITLERKICLVIVPFHKRFTTNGTSHPSIKGIQIMTKNVLDKAPCSVAILVDRGLFNSWRPVLENWSSYRVAVLFLGGADDREALALGSRMARHPNIHLTVVRVLENGNIHSNDTKEMKLDNEVVSDFRLNIKEMYRIKYMEEVVMDASGTTAVIKSMENNYELIIVGRLHDNHSPLMSGLADWNEHTELGEIGDMLASADFRGNTTVLVVQQHMNGE